MEDARSDVDLASSNVEDVVSPPAELTGAELEVVADLAVEVGFVVVEEVVGSVEELVAARVEKVAG